MQTLIGDFVVVTVFFLGLVVPLCWWVWIGFCKYILHFHKDCDNRNCLYRCNKCPHLHSERLQMRIKRLENRETVDKDYIAMLKAQLQIYLQDPDLDRETESKMINRLAEQAEGKKC